MLFYSREHPPRLLYIVDFISKQLFDVPLTLTTDTDVFRAWTGPKFNYSPEAFSEAEFYLKPVDLLFETGIRVQAISCFELNFHKAFFATKGDLPFDILAATFYLLSRYEEYLPHEKDEYGRYSHRESLAYREGFLKQPLVNIWLDQFRTALQRKFPELALKPQQFTCQVTYDIDMAYAYREKGWLLNTGGLLRDLLKGKLKAVGDRWDVLQGKKKDPNDCFEWLDALHLYCRVKPLFFFLVARARKGVDKNSPLSSKIFRELIEYYARIYKIGLHPSWQSGDDPSLLKEEAEWLEVVSETPITISRQHFIRMTLPQTYSRLMEAGIRKDYSMGYGTINGFRASVAASFPWYDLQEERSTPLIVYPYCFMDANAYYEQHLEPGQAYTELMDFYHTVKKYRGLFITVWHNNLLGTAPEFKGWREMFELFMRENVYWDAYYDQS